MGSVSRSTAVLILTAVNSFLILGGVLILYFAIDIRNSGWVDVLDGYYANAANAIIISLNVLGGIVIALGSIGILSAVFRWKRGLLVFSIALVVVFVLLILVSIGGFLLASHASDWQKKGYPVNNDEVSLRSSFEKAYCYAQGIYICNELPLSEASGTLISKEAGAIANSVLGNSTLGDVCGQAGDTLMHIDSIQSACSGCSKAAEYKNYSSLLDWANAQCPRSTETLLWCGDLLIKQEETPTSGTDPYYDCRRNILSILSSYGNKIGVGGLIGALGSLLSIASACFLQRTKHIKDNPANELQYNTMSEEHRVSRNRSLPYSATFR